MEVVVDVESSIIVDFAKPTIANKIGSAVEMVCAEMVEGMSSDEYHNSSRAQTFFNRKELLNPISAKGGKKKTTKKDDEATQDGDASESKTETADAVHDDAVAQDENDAQDGDVQDGDVAQDEAGLNGDVAQDDNDEIAEEEASGYTYYGLGKKKDPATGETITLMGAFPKKKFASLSLQTKQILQCLLSMYAKEVLNYYESNDNSFPCKQEEFGEAIKKFAQQNSTISIAPFIFENAKLCEDLVGEITDEPKKGTQALTKCLETEFKKAFGEAKGGKSISGKIEEIINIYVKFLKVFCRYFTNLCWEHKVPLNQGVTLGVLRNMGMFVKPHGGYLEEPAFAFFDEFLKHIAESAKAKAKNAKPKDGSTKVAKPKGSKPAKAKASKAKGAKTAKPKNATKRGTKKLDDDMDGTAPDSKGDAGLNGDADEVGSVIDSSAGDWGDAEF